jgi:APA family basic amino acid/polyamine antiporter
MGWGGYFCRFLEGFGLTIPKVLTLDPFSGGIANIPAMAIVILTTLTFAFSVKIGSHSNGIVVVLKLLVIALFLGVGIGYVKPEHWHPFMPFGWDGVMKGAAYIFFAYIGFDAVSTAAEEAKNPQKSVPFGILGSLLVCTILYIVVALVLTGMVPYQKLGVPDPVAYALASVGVNWAAGIVSLGAIAGLTSVLLVMIFGQTRIFFAMSRDGLLPGFFARIHPRFRAPSQATLATGFIIALIATFFPIDVVHKLVNVGTLSAVMLVSIAVIVLRVRRPELERPFRVPAVPYVPLLAIGLCLWLIIRLGWDTLAVFLVWMATGFLIYALYARHHSVLARNASASPRAPPADPDR